MGTTHFQLWQYSSSSEAIFHLLYRLVYDHLQLQFVMKMYLYMLCRHLLHLMSLTRILSFQNTLDYDHAIFCLNGYQMPNYTKLFGDRDHPNCSNGECKISRSPDPYPCNTAIVGDERPLRLGLDLLTCFVENSYIWRERALRFLNLSYA